MVAHAAPSLPLVDPASSTRRLVLAHVTVFHHVAQAQTAWDEIAGIAPHSAFQTRAWLAPWLDTLGATLEPAFVVGRDPKGAVIAFLPLGVSRRVGLRAASFLGGAEAGFALGLFHPGAAVDDRFMRELLESAAREARIDLFVLQNQPFRWDGQTNPMAALPHQPSPSSNHSTALAMTAARFMAGSLSKKTRKRLRWKEGKLAALGPLAHETAQTDDVARVIIDTYLAQKRKRFDRLGIRDVPSVEDQRAFFVSASRRGPETNPSVEFHALRSAGEIVATFAGAAHRGRFSGMVMSFDETCQAARFGPGEVLLAKVIAAKCDAGFDMFDLGIGDASYKDAFCPEIEPLFDTILGITARGRLAAAAVTSVLRAKRTIKQTPWLWAGWWRIRRVLRISGRGALDDAV